MRRLNMPVPDRDYFDSSHGLTNVLTRLSRNGRETTIFCRSCHATEVPR